MVGLLVNVVCSLQDKWPALCQVLIVILDKLDENNIYMKS